MPLESLLQKIPLLNCSSPEMLQLAPAIMIYSRVTLTFQLTSLVASDNIDVTSQALWLATLLHEIFARCLFHDLGVCIFCDT